MDRPSIMQCLLQRVEHEAGVRRARDPPLINALLRSRFALWSKPRASSSDGESRCLPRSASPACFVSPLAL
jgi:hypothetical protein